PRSLHGSRRAGHRSHRHLNGRLRRRIARRSALHRAGGNMKKGARGVGLGAWAGHAAGAAPSVAAVSSPTHAPSPTPRAPCCFHCGEPLDGSTFTARIHGRDEPVCCAGCLAVAELIAGAGLDDFYRFREAPSARPDESALQEDTWAAYEREEVANQFVTHRGEICSVPLLVEGLRCAACGWLIDRIVSRTPGVAKIELNSATGRAHVEFDSSQLNLGQLLRMIARLGYRPYPASDET